MRISTLVKMFKKIKMDTHENLGFGQVRYRAICTPWGWWAVRPDRPVGQRRFQGRCWGINLLQLAPIYLMCAAGFYRGVPGEGPYYRPATIFV